MTTADKTKEDAEQYIWTECNMHAQKTKHGALQFSLSAT
jgi:hypothetical protein